MTAASPTTTTSSDGTLNITLTGEIDILTVGAFRAELEAALDAKPAGVVFDLTDVTFIDSSGLGLIALPLSADVPVTIRNPSAIVRRIISAVGFDEAISIEPAVPDPAGDAA